ncbi:hypothetical protein [Dankookia sp. P2]|uniref:hypothetical protein n=1 Tax=Dankookia sp. P2 TaxID=3423955 RepID=UPI003D67F5ED
MSERARPAPGMPLPRRLGRRLGLRPAHVAAGPPSLALGPPRLLRSAGLRFAVLFAAMFAFAAVALVAVLWWATAGALDRQTDAVGRADAIALSERWREAGNAGLAEAIEERLAVDVENEAIYLMMEAEVADASPATSTVGQGAWRRPGPGSAPGCCMTGWRWMPGCTGWNCPAYGCW